MRIIESINEINNDYKYIIGLTPEDARVLETSLKLLPKFTQNLPEMTTLMKAVGDVAAVQEKPKVTVKDILPPGNCLVCDD